MTRRSGSNQRWEHIDIDWLVQGEGDITIGRLGPIRCVATAADGHNALAMLVRRPHESLEELLTRLDDAIRSAIEDESYIDEINP